MSWIIEEISVRHRGEHSRLIRVLVDEYGNITNEPVPDAPYMNLDCISDYRYNNRIHGYDYNHPNNIITTFCNYQTFTHYTVRALPCKPLAYVEAVENSPECGYQEPLPTPAKPPNPFGGVPYNTYKFFRFCSNASPELGLESNQLRVNIKKKNYNGPELEIPAGGRSPVVLSYKGEKEDPIRGCEAKLTFVATQDFSLAQLYSDDEREYMVDIFEELPEPEPEPITVNWQNRTGGFTFSRFRIWKNGIAVIDSSSNQSGDFSAVKGDILTFQVDRNTGTTQVQYIALELPGIERNISASSQYLTGTVTVGTQDINVGAYNYLIPTGYQHTLKQGSFTRIDSGGGDVVFKNPVAAAPGANLQSVVNSITITADFNERGKIYANRYGSLNQTLLPVPGLIFRGFIIPDSCQEDFSATPYEVSITATDILGTLKKITYPVPVGSKIDIRQRFIDILAYALAMTNLNLPIFTINNLYEVKMPNGANDDPTALASVNPLRMSDEKGNIFSCYEALEYVCRQFNAILFQEGGAWHFVREPERSWDVIRRRKYNSEGLFLYADQAQALVRAGGLGVSRRVLNGSTISIGNAYKRVPVLLEYGKTPSVIWNGDFEQWDGQNFNYWTRYGGINVSQVQNTIKNSAGQDVPLLDYRLQFNERTDIYGTYKVNQNKFIKASDISVQLGDKINFKFDFFRTQVVRGGYQNVQNAVLLNTKIQVGEWFLVNSAFNSDRVTILPDGNKLEWVNRETYCVLLVAGAFGDSNESLKYTFSISIPDVPKTDQMRLSLYGVTEYPYSDKDSVWGKILNAKQGNEAIYGIDNIGMSKESASVDVDGIMYLSEQTGFYTTSPDEIKIIWGDTAELFVTDGENSQNVLAQKLFAIYTSDNSYSKSWYEYGKSQEPLSIGMRLAKSIIQAYQRPYRLFEGEFMGDFSYMSVLNIDKLTGRSFAVINADFDLKYRTMNALLSEIFYKEIKTNDNSIPHTPGQELPTIAQDPTGGQSDGKKIFTKEFANEFL